MSSKKPNKQRKIFYNLPLHKQKIKVVAKLSEELQSEYSIKRLPIRKGDTVRVLRGEHTGYEGKVTKVDRRRGFIYIEGLTRKKSDGSDVQIPISASKVEITKLDLSDKLRLEIIRKKAEQRKTYLEKLKQHTVQQATSSVAGVKQ